MRILHTADLHLGRRFHGLSMADDHAAVLEQMLTALQETAADVLVIAGDVFDRANPPAEAVDMFNDFLRRACECSKAVIVIIAGNHDSGARIDMMDVFATSGRALVRGTVRAREQPLLLQDVHGTVAISALPFAHEHAARACFQQAGDDRPIYTPADVLAAQMAAARAALPATARHVVVAHVFVQGAAVGTTERPLTRIGGVETVPSSLFDGAHYVALGHLHRAQQAGAPHIRYAGAPLAFDFGEDDRKSLTFVELNGAGQVHIELLPLTPLRAVRTIRGPLQELLQLPPSEDFIRAELTDEAPRIDPMRRLRQVFPNACQLEYVSLDRAPEVKGAPSARRQQLDDPLVVATDFLHLLRRQAVDDGNETDGETDETEQTGADMISAMELQALREALAAAHDEDAADGMAKNASGSTPS